MSSRRTAKVAQAIRQVVSSAILTELRDPRVQMVTVLHTEVAHDLRSAKVYVSILGEDADAHLALQGLNSSRGWLQRKIADELELRYTPVLTFVIDDGVKKSIAASRLLRETLGPQDAPTDTDELAADDGDDEPSEGDEASTSLSATSGDEAPVDVAPPSAHPTDS